MKVALVHDWFVGGGAERVVYELHKIYPKAPIYTAYCSPEWRQKLSGTPVITSYMQSWPFSKLRKFLPILRALWFSRLDLSGYDLVISSSGAEAKGIRLRPRVTSRESSDSRLAASGSNVKQPLHICYCHAPTHYYWSRYEQYIKNPGFGRLDPLARLGLKVLLAPMRRWDYQAAQRPHFMIANSNYTKEQIKKYYGRDSVVIHPPVEIDRFQLAANAKSKAESQRVGFVTAGRQTPYKRIDLAVQACTQLNLPLVVLGGGPEHTKLKRLAGKSVTFLKGKTDEELAHYFKTSLGFIFPNADDFGVVAVEALAAGTPVIAYQAGGALDYIQPGLNGLFFKDQTAAGLADTLKKFNPEAFNNQRVAKTAAKFSCQNFNDKMAKFIKTHVLGNI